MLANAIYQRLVAYEPLTALVGTRVYPSRAPDGAQVPYVVYSDQAPVDQVPDLAGVGTLAQTRVQTEAWALTATQAKQVGDAVQGALRGFTGTIAGVSIQHITLDGGFDDYDDEAKPILYRRLRDFLIHHHD